MKKIIIENISTLFICFVLLFIYIYPDLKKINLNKDEVGRYSIFPNSTEYMLDTKNGTVFKTEKVNNKRIWVIYGTISNLTFEDAKKLKDSEAVDTTAAL